MMYHTRVERKITLKEVLIAVGILIALAAIVGTILLKNQADARRVASSRNLQQWGIALNLYLIDNENQLPATGKDPVTEEQKTAWYNALPPYISQTPLAELPPGQRPRPGEPSLWIDPSTKPVRVWDGSVFFFNYGMNKFLQPEQDVRSFRIYELNNPANVIFLTEVEGYTPNIGPEDVVFRLGSNPKSPKAETYVLFCDGHVQTATRQTLVDDPNTLNASAAETGISWFQK